jgi:hypothetical protein
MKMRSKQLHANAPWRTSNVGSYAMRGAREDTLTSLQRAQMERERIHKHNEREAATTVIDAFCDAKGWPEEDRLLILAALGLDDNAREWQV